MNIKDYKKIAKIIKDYWVIPEQFVDDLADYIEKEDLIKARHETYKAKMAGKEFIRKLFDRKQFKKWCGVKKS